MIDTNELKSLHKKLRAHCLESINKILTPNLISPQQKEALRGQLSQQIKDVYDQAWRKVTIEQERQAKDLLAELYRERILTKQYEGTLGLGQYFKDWQELERTFFATFAPPVLSVNSSASSGNGLNQSSPSPYK